jgi:hypothetical protein
LYHPAPTGRRALPGYLRESRHGILLARMNPTDEQLARFQTALKEDYGRDFTKEEASDAWRRLDTFYRLVTGQLVPPKKDPDQAANR